MTLAPVGVLLSLTRATVCVDGADSLTVLRFVATVTVAMTMMAAR